MAWIDIEQNTDEWHKLRLGKITASNFGAVMADGLGSFGETAHKYALQLALERINGGKSNNQIQTYHMKRGHQQEPNARSLYESQHFYTATNGGFFDHGYYGDSPDGLVGNDGIVEIKSVIASVQYATLKRNNYDPKYKWQMVGHLECSCRKWCDFISYCADFPAGKQLLVHRMHKDEVLKEIGVLKEKREQFNLLIEKIINEINTI